MSPPKYTSYRLVDKPDSHHNEEVGDIWKDLYVVHWHPQGMRYGKCLVPQSQ